MAVIASSQYLASLADVKEHLKIENTELDSWLDKQLSSITKRIQTFTNRIFKANTYTEFHDGTGRRGFIYVFNPPVGTVSVFNEDVNREFGSSTEFASNTFIKYEEDGKVELLNVSDVINTDLNSVILGKGQKNIKIVYTGGFADIPEDVRLGALEWIAELNSVRDKNRWGVQNVNVRDISTTYDLKSGMPANVKEMVQDYKLYRVGRRI